MIQQLDKRPNKMHDTAIGAYYLFNGGYNPITSPRSFQGNQGV